MSEDLMIMIRDHEMQTIFMNLLQRYGFTETNAVTCASIFTENSIDGIYTHGVNRFVKFIQYIKNDFIKIDAVPSLQNKFAAMEQWHGNFGPGILNALHATDRSMELATEHGVGFVTMANTNHWLRGGTYGWRAAKKDFAFICWTNTIPNMPAWGARDARLGNNPLVFAIPFGSEAIVLDMAMSQYSFGAMEMMQMKGEKLSVNGGYNNEGVLTNDPAEILESRRPLPIGYWKGAGLTLLLDLFAAVLSGGLSTQEISVKGIEYCSQVFIAIDLSKLHNHSSIAMLVKNIIDDYQQSVPVNEQSKITYPGERILQTRNKNLAEGIPVMKNIWEEILAL
ncbi:MAG: 3-dehydro-L-gulonate 2-dehydrogenase [Ferruginibacter sp.]